MTRINAIRSIVTTRNSVTWGRLLSTRTAGALVFAALLIVCSVTVGCSSDNDNPKPVSSNMQTPATPAPSQISPMPAPLVQAEAKPSPKKVVRKKPATVNYTDQTSGLTFEYPRRYAIETGNAATELLASTPLPMNFVQPGGVALAAVELPETSFANTDFSSAFFNVSIHKSLTADQCSEFAVPQPKSIAKSEATPTPAPSTGVPVSSQEVAKEEVKDSAKPDAAQPAKSDSPSVSAEAAPAANQKIADPIQQKTEAKSAPEAASGSKLLLGDLELRATEAVSGEGARQSDSKYFHVFQNGACYEFALNVTTEASDQGVTKHVDRDKVFSRLEQILSTVKINPVAAPEVTAEAPTPAEAPAQ